MKWNKKNARIMLTILIVALVGTEVQSAIQKALNQESKRPDIIRRFGRTRIRNGHGSRKDGMLFEDNEELMEC